jgi:hypothetical protein
MENFGRLLADALKKRGILSEGEVERLVSELTEKLKLRNVLTEKELGEVARCLHHFELPEPTGWAHAMLIHIQRNIVEEFSADKVYGAVELRNLKTTLHAASARNKKIFEKLENAAQVAEEYGIE